MSQCIRSYLVDTKFALWNSGGGTPQRYKQWFLRDFKDYTKPFDCVDHNKLWKTLKEMETLDHLIWTWKLDMEKRTGSKLVKEYIKAVYHCSIISQDNNNCWIIEKAREFQKKIYFCFIDYAKAFDCVYHNKRKILQEMGIPDHLICLTCLLRNLYAGQEATVRTGHGTMGWFWMEKGVC